MKRTDPKILGDIIHDALQRSGMESKFARQRAAFLWAEIVGPTINRLTYKRWVDNDGILHVYLTSASLKNDLLYMRSTLLRRLNEAVGSEALTDIMIH